jgi:hypothetical protein
MKRKLGLKKEIKQEEVKATPKNLPKPLMAGYSEASDTRTRRNAASNIERTDKYTNIENGLVPFSQGSGYGSGGHMDVREPIILTQKAYYNFSIFRNTIELMTEFSVSPVYYKGGSKKSREFFEALFNKINLWGLQDKFFREYYRSGNVFVYRFDGKLKQSDLDKITQAFGLETSNAAAVKIPVRYVILNPADIQVAGQISFSTDMYFKVLTPYEIERLRNPKTEEDEEMLESLGPEVKKKLEQKVMGTIAIELDPEKFLAVFYKKQDYEPMAVPMGFPVLEDINWKAEMKKMDMALTRTIQQVILLITMGSELKDGGINLNEENLAAMQALFENQSVGRVLVADWTTEAKWVIPDIAQIIDPKKYAQVDKDIQMGLNNILIGEEKFANAAIRIQVFVARLHQARKAFLNDFLIPEIKRIAKQLGFKNYPTPYFEDIDLKDELEYAKIYTRLMELGVLTPEEGLEAIDTNRLPTAEESLESQKKFKGYKEEGLYQPIVGGPADQKEMAEINNQAKMEMNQQKLSQQAGRPKGTKAPQSTKKMTPIGGATEIKFSTTKIVEHMNLAAQIQALIEDKLKKKFKLKVLSDEQKAVAKGILDIVVANEDPENWRGKYVEYIKSPVDTHENRVQEVQEIAYKFQVDSYIASILYASKI